MRKITYHARNPAASNPWCASQALRPSSILEGSTWVGVASTCGHSIEPGICFGHAASKRLLADASTCILSKKLQPAVLRATALISYAEIVPPARIHTLNVKLNVFVECSSTLSGLATDASTSTHTRPCSKSRPRVHSQRLVGVCVLAFAGPYYLMCGALRSRWHVCTHSATIALHSAAPLCCQDGVLCAPQRCGSTPGHPRLPADER